MRVPRALQDEVRRTYHPGQCDDGKPSKGWHRAASAAIGAVALKEGQLVTKEEREALDYYGVTGLTAPEVARRRPLRASRVSLASVLDEPVAFVTDNEDTTTEIDRCARCDCFRAKHNPECECGKCKGFKEA